MKKRVIAILLLLCAVLSLTGCDSFLNGQYEYVAEHTESESDSISETSGMTTVSNYAELKTALLNLVKTGSTAGKVRFLNYSGNPESDSVGACMEISQSEPLGAYSVYYINSTVTSVLSTQQAEIFITYKRTPRQISAVTENESPSLIVSKLSEALTLRKPEYVVLTSVDGLDLDFAHDVLRDSYYNGSDIQLMLPTVVVNQYPDDALPRVVEFLFTYPYPTMTLDSMYSALMLQLAGIKDSVKDEPDPAKTLLAVFEELSERAFRLNSPLDLIDDTAYGAYVNGRATDLGMAMAFKSAANYLGYECYTVSGRFKNVDHYWNIVKCGDYYYHCDPFRAAEKGVASCIFRTDAEISREYSWEEATYPVCDGDLNYYSVSQIYG